MAWCPVCHGEHVKGSHRKRDRDTALRRAARASAPKPTPATSPFRKGQRVNRGPGRYSSTSERDYGKVVSSAARNMREDGVGDLEPHVRVLWDDQDEAYWYPVRKLR